VKEHLEKVKKGVAVIGSGFIGSESAAAIKMHFKDKFEVHLVGQKEHPLESAFGKIVGGAVSYQH
jgi:3-hydroxyacyl-CoA dehydrogenase